MAPGGLIAFARVLDQRAALVIVPRLVAGMVWPEDPVPLGGNAWKTSRILLPPSLHGKTFRNELTGLSVHPATSASEEWLFAGQVFEHVPVGILTVDSH
jgi:maltooligosyltrehalose synthase